MNDGCENASRRIIIFLRQKSVGISYIHILKYLQNRLSLYWFNSLSLYWYSGKALYEFLLKLDRPYQNFLSINYIFHDLVLIHGTFCLIFAQSTIFFLNFLSASEVYHRPYSLLSAVLILMVSQNAILVWTKFIGQRRHRKCHLDQVIRE